MDLSGLVKLHVLSSREGLRAAGVWGLVALVVGEELVRHLPAAVDRVRAHLERRRAKTTTAADGAAPCRRSRLQMEYEVSKESPGDPVVEAVLRTITASASSVVNMRYALGRYMPDAGTAFDVVPDVQCKVLHAYVDAGKGQLLVSLELSSDTRSMTDLRAFVDACHEGYRRELHNKLGDQLFMFDQTHSGQSKLVYNARGDDEHMEVPGELRFVKHHFFTTRTFDNVFYEQRDAVRDRVRFFLDRPDWYRAKGVPHALGLLLHGEPGCGKTSTIKAVANVARRHIVNVNMSTVCTKEQLRQLFYDEVIQVPSPSGVDQFSIPIDQRVYVVEDIDCMTDLVLSREHARPPPPPADKKSARVARTITLSDLLNVLDGVLETPGRIVIMTTNYVDRLDSALIRPGRIDMIVRFDKASPAVVAQMFESFFDLPFPEGTLQCVESGARSPAEVSAVLFRCFGDPQRAIRELSTW